MTPRAIASSVKALAQKCARVVVKVTTKAVYWVGKTQLAQRAVDRFCK